MADLFSDGFESGDLTAWSSNENNSGDLSATEAAALHGSYGLNCLINDSTNMYVQDDTPNSETEYRIRAYFDPNSIYMENNNEIAIVRAGNNGNTIFDVTLKYTDANNYTIYVGIVDDGSGWTYINAVDVGDTPHCIEVYWIAATDVGQNDGIAQLWVDGVSAGTQETLDTDTKTITQIQVGAPGKGDMGASSGTFFIDDFASNNDGSEIGLISGLIEKAIVGALSFTGSIIKSPIYTKLLAGVMNFAGSLTNKIAIGISGIANFIGNVTKAAMINRKGALAFAGNAVKMMPRSLSGMIPFYDITRAGDSID